MNRMYVTASFLALLSGFSSGTALASPMDAYFSGDKNSCFERTYSKAHLQKHPQQRVSYIAVRHFVPGTAEGRAETLKQYASGEGPYVMEIHVRFRGSKQGWSESLSCNREADYLRCGVECDGGDLEIHGRGTGKILIRTGKYGFRVMANGGCGDAGENDENIRYITRKSDDKAFLLWKVSASQCVTPQGWGGE